MAPIGSEGTETETEPSRWLLPSLIGVIVGGIVGWLWFGMASPSTDAQTACEMVARLPAEPAIGDHRVTEPEIYRLTATADLAYAAQLSDPVHQDLGEAGQQLRRAIESIDRQLAVDAMQQLADACN